LNASGISLQTTGSAPINISANGSGLLVIGPSSGSTTVQSGSTAANAIEISALGTPITFESAGSGATTINFNTSSAGSTPSAVNIITDASGSVTVSSHTTVESNNGVSVATPSLSLLNAGGTSLQTTGGAPISITAASLGSGLVIVGPDSGSTTVQAGTSAIN